MWPTDRIFRRVDMPGNGVTTVGQISINFRTQACWNPGWTFFQRIYFYSNPHLGAVGIAPGGLGNQKDEHIRFIKIDIQWMEITFRTKKLQRSCSVAKEAVKAYGQLRARKLMQRLMELRAADYLSDIPSAPPPRCHELTGNLAGKLSVDLDHPWRLIFRPAHDPVPVRESGGLDWSQVTAIEITDIMDPH